MNADVEEALVPVADALDALAIDYFLTGSVSSSLFGVPRSTVDADLVAAIRREHAVEITRRLEPNYYVDVDVIRDAISRGGMFNVIHLATMFKVDVYALRTSFDRSALARRRNEEIITPARRPFPTATPEDVVLHKLRWFRDGGETSDRQWGDILGVLRIQHEALDLDHMRTWAEELGVTDLLDRARAEAQAP